MNIYTLPLQWPYHIYVLMKPTPTSKSISTAWIPSSSIPVPVLVPVLGLGLYFSIKYSTKSPYVVTSLPLLLNLQCIYIVHILCVCIHSVYVYIHHIISHTHIHPTIHPIPHSPGWKLPAVYTTRQYCKRFVIPQCELNHVLSCL